MPKLAVMLNPHAQVTQQGPVSGENREFDALWELMRKHGMDAAYTQFLPGVNESRDSLFLRAGLRPSEYLRPLEEGYRKQYIDDAFRGIDRTQSVIPRGEESFATPILGDDKVAATTWEYAPTVKEKRSPKYDAQKTRSGIEQAFRDHADFDLTSKMETPGVIHRAVG